MSRTTDKPVPAEPARRDASAPPHTPDEKTSDDTAAAPDAPATEAGAGDPSDGKSPKKKKRHRLRRLLLLAIYLLILMLIGARLVAPTALQWYVNRTIDQSPLYDGEIGDIDIHLWRGAYSIEHVRLIKTTGNVPVPLFAAERVDLAVQWDNLLNGKIVGRIAMQKPELNFVDGEDSAEDQTGVGGPWLDILQDLFPFKINACELHDGSIHFRNAGQEPPVDIYLSRLDASIENLTNVQDSVTPMVATVKASALAMDHARFEYQMKFNPFSYRPSFQMAVRLIGLDVTKINQFARAYGAFDFERGRFDLVVELDAKEGRLEGLVKPLFRDLKVLSVKKDIKEDNAIEFFWEAVVGVAAGILKNQPRDQLGTSIPLSGDLNNPQMSIVTVVINVLRNAFVRAYLPRLEGVAEDIDGLTFGRGSVTDPKAVGD